MFNPKETIDLSDVWEPSDDWDADHAQDVAEKFSERAVTWSISNPEIGHIIEELKDAAEADDPSWFNNAWAAMYDHADADRIFIKTR